MHFTQNYAGTITITVSAESVDSLIQDGLVIGYFSDERPPRGLCGFVDWRLNGLISRHVARGTVTGTFMEKVLITPHKRIPSSKLLIIGLGESSNLTYERLHSAGQAIAETLSRIQCNDAAFDIPSPHRCGLNVSEMTTAMISGFAETLLGKNSQTDSHAVSVLGDDSYRDEITLGVNQFKVNVKHTMKVFIHEA